MRESTRSDLVSLREAATLLGVAPSTLRGWIRIGKVDPPSRPVNGHLAYARFDLESLRPPAALSAASVRNGSSERQLRPFFGYYGGKWRDALKHYPAPRYGTIVEPFAGSAGYSMRYPDRKIILCELDPIIATVWSYLIRVKPKEILSIRDLAPGETVDDLKVGEEAQLLVGLWLNRGIARPRKSPSKWMREGIRPGSFWGRRVKETIASQVDAIRHWKVYNRSYEHCPSPREATWFIDPPYERAGGHYTFGPDGLDYAHLAAWCRSRRGQILVCENAGATWLPFRVLGEVKTTRAKRRSKEVYWLNDFGSPDRRLSGKHA